MAVAHFRGRIEILDSASPLYFVVKDYLRKAGGKLIAVAEKKGPHVAAQNIIQVVTKSTKPRAFHHWKRIKKQHPETINDIYSFPFPA